MDGRRNIHSDVEINPCLKCIASCCKLEVDINKDEYNHLCSIGLKEHLTTRTEMFLKMYSNYSDKKDFLDNLYGETFAIIDKGEDGYCKFLDRKTRLCTIYNDRPSACKQYSNKGLSCKSIRKWKK